MKFLMLKDFYNIKHNLKQLFILVLIFAVTILPNGPEGFMITISVMCATLITTTFSFDERSNWSKYALIMPVSRKSYVKSKYCMSLLFGGAGMVLGIVCGIIGGIIIKRPVTLSLMLTCILVSLIAILFINAFMIPQIIKFGTEKARITFLIIVIIPTGLVLVGSRLLKYLQIEMTDMLFAYCLIALFVLSVGLFIGSYYLSVKLFSKKEF